MSNFLDLFGTDFIGAFLSIFTNLLGPAFWGLITLIIVTPLHNRIGTLPVVIISIFAWVVVFIRVMSSEALQLGYAVSVLAIGIVIALFMLYWRR